MKNKRKNKHILKILLVLVAALVVLSGCSGENAEKEADKGQNQKDSSISVVCSSFPEYDWVMNVLGSETEGVKVTLLNTQGTDLHSFQPTAENMVEIAGCDLFVYVGGISESWAEGAIKASGNAHVITLPLIGVIQAKEETLLAGMENNEDSHNEDDEHNHDGDVLEYDEHIWLSLKCAEDSCKAIYGALCEIAPDKEALFSTNLEEYLNKLKALECEYIDAVESSDSKALLFADRFPFRYLAEDYHLECFAAFPGCSAETEASFETIVFLAHKVDELKLSAVITIDGGNQSMAETVIENCKSKGVKILEVNSMQSVTQQDINNGATYLSIMKDNLNTFSQALS